MEEIQRNNASPEHLEPDFTKLFREFVAQSVQATLDEIPDDALFLDEEMQQRVMHVLSYVLKVADAWPATKALILRISLKMEQAGHRDNWIQYLERGVVISREQDDQQAEAELCLYVGELLRLRSKFELARHWLKTSIAIFSALHENQGQARALNELAFVAWQQHSYDKAEELSESALALLDTANHESATCFSHLGAVALERKQWRQAERYHRDALEIRQAHGDQRKIAWSLQNLGSALRGQGEYQEAINCYRQAVAILEELHDLMNLAITQMDLAITTELCNQHQQALELYALAESVFRQFRDQFYIAKISVNKGICYLTLQKWQQAEQAFLAGANLFWELGNIGENLNALDGLGLVHLNQGQYNKASIIFQSALNELSQIAGTPIYDYLATALPAHLSQASEMQGNSRGVTQ